MPGMPGNQFQSPFVSLPQQQAPQMQVVRVNGRNGAQAYTIGPNSSALLLDESGTMVWLVTTDGASYKTVAAYDIAPHQDTPVPDLGNIESRIARLEEFVNEYAADPSAAPGSKPDTKPAANPANAGYGTLRK